MLVFTGVGGKFKSIKQGHKDSEACPQGVCSEGSWEENIGPWDGKSHEGGTQATGAVGQGAGESR